MSDIPAYFNHLAQRFPHTAHAEGWYSRETQHMRFDAIRAFLPDTPFSLLDVGCGQGDFYHDLKLNHSDCQYVGIDFAEAQIALAQAAYPSGTFFVQDLLTHTPNTPYDIGVACGTFNLLQPQHQDYFLAHVRKLLRLCTSTVLVNALKRPSNRIYHHPDTFAYFSEREYREMCQTLDVPFTTHAGYLDNDILLVFRPSDARRI